MHYSRDTAHVDYTPAGQPGVVDACAFPAWPPMQTLVETLDGPWKELLMRPGDRQGPVPVLSPRLFADPHKPEPQAVGDLVAQFEATGVERAVLGWDDGLFCTAFPYRHIARTIVRAANDWLIRDALAASERCYGMMLVSAADPVEAASEIRRIAVHERIVAVALGCNALGRPFGDKIYLPIHEAAAELQLPIVVQVGSDATTDLVTPPVAGGLPATFAEFQALAVHSHMSHVSSMIVEGLFDRLPGLRVLLVGGGFGWVPSWLWRFNLWYKRGRRTQAPWLTRPPSEYFVDHVRVTTTSLEPARAGFHLERVFDALPALRQVLLYASCFPVAAPLAPETISERLPEAWRRAVMTDNALAFYRWPTPGTSAAA